MRLCRCGAIVRKGLCERCKPPAPKQDRGTTKERGYGHDWRRLSELARQEEPLCKVHEARGIVRPATERHHIEKIRDAPDRRLDFDNTISVCGDCHKEIEGMGREELKRYLQQLKNEA